MGRETYFDQARFSTQPLDEFFCAEASYFKEGDTDGGDGWGRVSRGTEISDRNDREFAGAVESAEVELVEQTDSHAVVGDDDGGEIRVAVEQIGGGLGATGLGAMRLGEDSAAGDSAFVHRLAKTDEHLELAMIGACGTNEGDLAMTQICDMFYGLRDGAAVIAGDVIDAATRRSAVEEHQRQVEHFVRDISDGAADAEDPFHFFGVETGAAGGIVVGGGMLEEQAIARVLGGFTYAVEQIAEAKVRHPLRGGGDEDGEGARLHAAQRPSGAAGVIAETIGGGANSGRGRAADARAVVHHHRNGGDGDAGELGNVVDARRAARRANGSIGALVGNIASQMRYQRDHC